MHFKIAGVVSFLLAVSTLALAQKNEVSVSVGAMATSDQQTRLLGITCPVGFPNCAGPVTASTDTGVAFEGDYVRQIFNLHLASIGAEFPIVGVPHRDVTMTAAPGIPISPQISSQSSVFFTPSARIEFLPSGRISPFFSLGGGWVHYERTTSINRGALQFGGGADFKTPLPHFAIRLELRDFWAKAFAESGGLASVEPERLHNVFGGGGIVFKF